MREFTMESREALLKLLSTRKIMSEEQVDSFTLALYDIRESIVEIYDRFLPKLVNALESRSAHGDDIIDDMILEIREACRHIDYHLHDAKLPPGS